MTREEAKNAHGCQFCVLMDPKSLGCRQTDLPLGGLMGLCPVPAHLHSEWIKKYTPALKKKNKR
jgi:hypothetical protein